MRLLIVFLLFSTLTYAQSGPGNWFMYFGTNTINDTWSIHTEAQHRNYGLLPNELEQLLLRTGINYKVSDGLVVTGGYANITNHVQNNDTISPEVEGRIWQQLIAINYFGKTKFEHRFRYEQRWIENDFKTRYRYRGMLFHPLNSERLKAGTLYLGIYNELFLQPSGTTFDRNRFYTGLGYKYAPNIQFQLGYLLQTVGDNTGQYLQFGLIFDT